MFRKNHLNIILVIYIRMPTYEQNKECAKRYLDTHRTKINLYNKQWRTDNLEIHNERRKETYYYNKSINFDCEWKRLCNIKIC